MPDPMEELKQQQAEFQKEIQKQFAEFTISVAEIVGDTTPTAKAQEQPAAPVVIEPKQGKLLEEMQRMQTEYEQGVNKRLSGFMEAAMNTVGGGGPLTLPTGNVDYGVINPESGFAELLTRIVALEKNQSEVGFQLPISFRYRNDIEDGSGVIQRLEYTLKGSPYSDSDTGGTTVWPDDEWTAIPGADAEVYTP